MALPRLLAAFAAGFVSVLVFHQSAVLLLHLAGVVPSFPWSLAPTAPLGAPAVLSAAVFGGLWGILLALVAPHFPGGLGYWIAAFVFGAALPSVVAWFVVQPLKGLPVGNGFPLTSVVVALVVNGVWGVGTALLLSLAGRPALAPA